MKRIFLLIISFFILSCSSRIMINDSNTNSNNLEYKMKVSMEQFDSICVKDDLPRNLVYWKFLGLRQARYNQKNALFLLIRRKVNGEHIYRAEETMDDSIIIEKKVFGYNKM